MLYNNNKNNDDNRTISFVICGYEDTDIACLFSVSVTEVQKIGNVIKLNKDFD